MDKPVITEDCFGTPMINYLNYDSILECLAKTRFIGWSKGT